MARTVLKIDGMSCEMCSKKVSDSILKVGGVSGVRIDLEKGTADIAHEGAKDEDLIRAVLDAGFRSKAKHGLFR